MQQSALSEFTEADKGKVSSVLTKITDEDKDKVMFIMIFIMS
jgi:hypothetical protein